MVATEAVEKSKICALKTSKKNIFQTPQKLTQMVADKNLISYNSNVSCVRFEVLMSIWCFVAWEQTIILREYERMQSNMEQ